MQQYTIRAGEIEGILSDPFVLSGMDLYRDFCLFEMLPYAGGPAEQPADVYEALRTLIEEDRLIADETAPKPGNGGR